jgi:hypothetical protein
VEVNIRAYHQRDAAGLAEVFFRSVPQVARSDYTAAQVRAWAPEPRTAEWAHGEASDGRLVLVAANEDDRPVVLLAVVSRRSVVRAIRTRAQLCFRAASPGAAEWTGQRPRRRLNRILHRDRQADRLSHS